MKKPSSVVSLLITLMLAALVCIQGSEPVKDTHGNAVIAGEKYYIQSKSNDGGGIAPFSLNLSPLCPFSVVQSLIPMQSGLPVSFKVVDVPEKTTVETSSAVNIKFESEIWVCDKLSKFWEVDDSSTAGKEPFILLGNKPEEEKSQFKIEKTGDANTYKFTTSAGSVPIGTIQRQGFFGTRQLVVTKDDTKTILVKFIKYDATTSTSRVEKLGLRMFPFY